MENNNVPGGMITPTNSDKKIPTTDEVSQKATQIAMERLQGGDQTQAFEPEPTDTLGDEMSTESEQQKKSLRIVDNSQSPAVAYDQPDTLTTENAVAEAEATFEPNTVDMTPIEPVIEQGVTPEAPEPLLEAAVQPVDQPSDTPTVVPAETPAVPPAPVQQLPAFMAPPSAEPAKDVNAAKPSKRKLLAPIALVVGAIVVLGGGSAAAYYGFKASSSPENKILSALGDFASQKEMTTEGIIDYSPVKAGTGISVTYKAATNMTKNNMSVAGTVGVKGTQFPYEVRYLDKNVYMKVGGLSGLSNVIPAGNAAMYGPYVDVLKQVNDQWYVIDGSMLQSLGGSTSCITDISFVLTDNDIDKIKNAYQKHPLFTVKSSSEETVDGEKTTKYVLDPTTKTEANAFASDISEVSVLKKIKECGSGKAEDTVKDAVADVDKGQENTLAIFVSDDKKLKKIELYAKDDTAAVKMTAVFKNGPVAITKPENAKPIQDLLGRFTGSNSTR